MKLLLNYRTEYRYGAPVSLSPHVFRLLPKADTHVGMQTLLFETNAGADIQYRRDLFDNIVACGFYPDLHCHLSVELQIELRLQEKNPFHFLLAPHAIDLPFTYESHEREVLDPFLKLPFPSVELPFWKFRPGPTLEVLIGLNRALFQSLKYERREEGAARTSAETLAAGGGACRDFAVLLAEQLRRIGVAARLASGYLWESDDAGPRRAEGALHAWTEAYLPGAGWVGMDAANGAFCNHRHITTAVGLSPEDIAPISGRYYAEGTVESAMSARLELRECDAEAVVKTRPFGC